MMKRIPALFKKFKIKKGFKSNGLIISSCPIHQGDNPNAFNLNISPVNDFYGSWFCNTKKCHEKYGRDILSFVRMLLERDKNREVSFNETLNFCRRFIKETDPDTIVELQNYTSENNVTPKGINIEEVREKLIFPPMDYINRGFSERVLKKFDVGFCNNKDSQMYNRTVFPVHSENKKSIVGCVGRSKNDNDRWKNQKGFNKSKYLYGLPFSKRSIEHQGKIILVEGQGSVLRLHDARYNIAVGMFGSALTNKQQLLLQSLKIDTVIIGTDNDEAGMECRKKIELKLKDKYKIVHIYSRYNDFEDMTVKQIQKDLKGKI